MIQNTITILYRQFNKFHICILTNQRTKDEENKKKETILSSLFEKKKRRTHSTSERERLTPFSAKFFPKKEPLLNHSILQKSKKHAQRNRIEQTLEARCRIVGRSLVRYSFAFA